MLLFTLLNLCASTGQTNGQTTCKECDEIGKIEKSANEWDKHTQDSQNYAKQLRENAKWRRGKHPYHVQKTVTKTNATNTTNVSTPVNINNNNNSSSTNIISISKTNVPSTAGVPEVSVSTTVPAAAMKTPAVMAAPTTTSNTPPVVSTATSTTPPAVMSAPTAPIKA